MFKKQSTVYILNGKRVPRGTPGAVKTILKSKKWYAILNDKQTPLSTNKEAAKIILGEKLRKAELRKANVFDPFEEHGQRPLLDHLADYRRFLESEGNCPEYVSKTQARIEAVLRGCGFAFPPDLTAEKVSGFLHQLRQHPARPELPPGQEWFTPRELAAALGGEKPAKLARLLRREGLQTKGEGKARRYPRATVEKLQELVCRGIGISTSNGYLTAVKGFSRWLFKKERIKRDRLAGLGRLNPQTDRRHERRALVVEELKALLAATGSSTFDFHGLTGEDRQMLYALAMGTGYRAKELSTLTPGSFDLDARPPTATVRAAFSKNRRESVQPLPLDVAAALRSYLANRPPDLPIFPGDWFLHAARMLRHDLKAAGIPYRDSEGQVCDFHGLRHSFVSLLARSDVHPSLAQCLARHSDIRLTMNVYTHVHLRDLASAVEGLPPLLHSPTPQTQPLQATGKGHFVCTKTALNVDSRGDLLRLNESINPQEAQKQPSLNPYILQGVEASIDSLRLPDSELPGQDSNLDKENQNILRRFLGSLQNP